MVQYLLFGAVKLGERHKLAWKLSLLIPTPAIFRLPGGTYCKATAGKVF
jgi:hypothetical protein